MAGKKQSALFICLGNICRSTMAEGIFSHILSERGEREQWEVDSAATSTYQIGNPPDKRAMKVMQKHGLSMDHRARQITKQDFRKFTYIFGMDEENMEDLESVKPKDSPAQLLMLGKYDTEGKSNIIVDPYFESGMGPFETVFEQCQRSCKGFLESLGNS